MFKTIKLPILAAAIFAALCAIFLNYYLAPFEASDTKWYLKIAEGDIGSVIQPFSGRVLHPLAVKLLSSLSGLSLDSSFFALSIAFLFGFIFLLSAFFSEIPFMNPLLTFLFAFSPFLLETFRNFYLPELFYGFLLLLFFYFLKNEKFAITLPLLFLLFFTRPTEALILGLIFVAFGFYRSEFKLVKFAAFVVIIGFLLSSQVSGLGLPNVHEISSFTFLVLKPVYNFVRSYLGIDWFTNTMLQYCAPRFLFSVPAWLNFGNIKSIGICEFNINRPLTTLLYFLTTFGVIPLALFFVLRRQWRQTFRENPLWFETALAYGLIMFFLGSLVSYGGLRTLGYGWPAFWLAAPVLFDKYLAKLTQAARGNIVNWFLVAHVILLWVPYLLI